MAFSMCYWANYTQGKNEVIPKVRKRSGGWPGFVVFVWRRLTSCWILSAMSPEIQEWSRKSRSRINNLYLLTRPITSICQLTTKHQCPMGFLCGWSVGVEFLARLLAVGRDTFRQHLKTFIFASYWGIQHSRSFTFMCYINLHWHRHWQ